MRTQERQGNPRIWTERSGKRKRTTAYGCERDCKYQRRSRLAFSGVFLPSPFTSSACSTELRSSLSVSSCQTYPWISLVLGGSVCFSFSAVRKLQQARCIAVSLSSAQHLQSQKLFFLLVGDGALVFLFGHCLCLITFCLKNLLRDNICNSSCNKNNQFT